MRWTYEALVLDPYAGRQHTPLSPAQENRRRKYYRALETARDSHATNPIFSGYHVSGAIGPVDGEYLPIGNREYGICQALHAEEAAVAALRSRLNGRPLPQGLILALVAGTEGNPVTPCGNCRDMLLGEFGRTSDVEVVSGPKEPGRAVITTLDQYFFESFKKIGRSREDVPQSIGTCVLRAIQERKHAAHPYYRGQTNPRPYAAVLTTRQPLEFGSFESRTVGSLELFADFHPLYPIHDAIRAAMRAHINNPLDMVVVVAEGDKHTPPHIPYKDRQHLLEFHTIGELLEKRQTDPPVYLVTLSEDNTVVGVWKTSIKQWYPLPFSMRNFGPDFLREIEEYYRAKKNE